MVIGDIRRKFKNNVSLKGKTLILTISILVIFFIGTSLFSYLSAKNLLLKEIDDKLYKQIEAISNSIRIKVLNNSKVVQSLVKSSEFFTGKDLNEYGELIKGNLQLNEDTFGMGIWFEKNKYKANIEQFAPYVYKKDGSLKVENGARQYPQYTKDDWYIMGKNTEKGRVGWSNAYPDPITNINMVTISSPFYNKSGEFIGVVTGDIDINNIIGMIKKIKVGKSGRAFLISENGEYISDEDSSKIMHVNIKSDSNKGLAAISKKILSEKSGELNFKDINGTSKVVFKEIPETRWRVGIILPLSEVNAPLTKLINTIGIIAIIALIITIIFILMGIKYLMNQIIKVNDLSKSMSQGDFTKNLEVDSQDELGQMVINLNTMANKLRTMFLKVNANVEQVVSSSQELSAIAEENLSMVEQNSNSIQELAEGSEKIEELTRESLDIVNEINKGVEQITNNIQEVVNASEETSQIADRGKEAVKNAVEQMDNIEACVSESADVIDILGTKSHKIGDIVSLIESVSEQTNLLALNAAIEAARAGEHGKGFAVVADEVRKLAEETKSATCDISVIIKEIQSEVKKAVVSMDEGKKQVQNGNVIVHDAGEAFANIFMSIENVSDQVHQVSAVIEELYAGMGNMVASIENMANISVVSTQSTETIAASSQEQKASMDEVAESAQLLSNIAMDLQEDFSKFKVE
ncbi:methyl-accepting chemotaxis protein [Hathewaya limosa]|uniref:Methyl-accepting chemotaxis protein n=1 Tax=Hathewaya limosa TaxID=1536 RepID=A0ABU0JPL8_HATLI|nr:methyl-accepting chemotaxis protein [Hathewaya limosa]MDQ0478360.1 methyl-accepting chemotaxis protein [Hathewaya limosa]